MVVIQNSSTQVLNHTDLTRDQILALPRLGSYRNEWRQRLVTLYRRGPGQVVSIGETFDGVLQIICSETDEDHCYALAAWAEGNFQYTSK